MNRLINPGVKLEETTHTYSILSNPGLKLTSCTEFIGSFFEPFDKFKIANKLVNNFPKYSHRTVESLIDEWEDAANQGTAVHKEIEDFISKQVKPNIPKAKQGVKWFCDFNKDDSHDHFPEVIIYSEEIKIAGTIDLLIHDKNKNTYSIVDWKTNKRIDQNSYRGKCGIKEPSYNLLDCNYIHYSLQMSLYQYILEEYYDLNVTQTKLIHLNEYGLDEYNCDYLVDNIKQMIEYSSF